MYNIPLVNGNGKPLTFGSEFNVLYGGEMVDGLQIPQDPILDYKREDGRLFTTLNLGGVDNQSKIFENNDDPSEEYQLTDAQALQNILNSSSLNRPLTEQEKKIQLYTDQPWDERFRQQLIKESIDDRSNIFHKESQDYVNSIRQANESYFRESNLYVPRSLLKPDPNKYKVDFKDPMSAGLNILMNELNKEKARQKGEKTYREKFTGGKFKPTQEQQFEKDIRFKKGEKRNPETGKEEEPSYYSYARNIFGI
jgi:hypothetical protein